MIDDYDETQWTNQSLDTIPIIDITPLLLPMTNNNNQQQQYDDHNNNNNDDDRFKCIQSIHQSCLQYGFFYISNISSILSSISTLTSKQKQQHITISKFQSTISNFFKLPTNILQSIQRTKDNSRGFFNNEFTKNKHDWKYCFDFGSQNGSLDNCGLDGFNQWPPSKRNDVDDDNVVDDNVGGGSGGSSSNNNNDDDFEVVMRDYYRQMEILAKILLGGIVESLILFGPTTTTTTNHTHNVDANILNQYFDGCHTSYLRLNYYPKCPNPSSHMAIHHHTDAGAITILYQDNHVSSLQVFNHDEEKWYYIPPKDDTFVINIGDMVQVWSNDLYKAPLHRVRANREVERYSAPFFYNPAYHTDVKPLFVGGSGGSDEDHNDNLRPKYRPLNWGEFRAKRFAGDYADVGEEVQISHYRIN